MVKVLVNYPIPADLGERLWARAGTKVHLAFAKDEEEAKREIGDAEILFGQMTPELLPLARKLRWVQTPFASQERHLFPEFIESDILLTNAAGIFNDEISDHVYALILGLTRDIPRFVRNQAQRHWASYAEFATECLAGKTLGIVGLGGIGGEVARRAPSFRIRVIATRAHPDRPKPDYVEEIWGPDGLSRLLAESDFVVICAPETPRTQKMIGRQELTMMKPTAYIINVGRGAIIDQAALTWALQNEVIAGAGLDVFEIEPLPTDHPLWGMDNVLITPHMAASTNIYPARRVEVFLDNLSRYLEGKPLKNIVDKVDWH